MKHLFQHSFNALNFYALLRKCKMPKKKARGFVKWWGDTRFYKKILY